MVWEGEKHLFFLFFLFLLWVWAPNNLWRKFGTMLRNYRTESFLGLSASLDFKKKFQNQKNNKDTFLEERLWPRSHLQNRLSGYLGNRTFVGCPVLATLGRIQWSGLACTLKQKPGSLPIARAISMSFI